MKNAICCMITDTHAKDDNLELVYDIFAQCLEYCLEHSINKIFFLGDFFTQRDKQSLECLLLLGNILTLMKKSGIEFYAIMGNHDKTDLTSTKGYMSIYKKSMKLFESETIIQIDGIDFCFLPFFKEGVPYLTRLSNIIDNLQSDRSVLLTHASINGVRNNDGSIVEKDIEYSFFKPFNRVFVGHYHDEQDIGKNIHYIGSGYQGNYGEDNKKGFTVLYSDLTFKKIRTDFPEYKKVKIDVTDKESIEKFITLHQDTNDNVRLIVTGSREELTVNDRTMLANADIDIKFESDAVKTSINDKEYVQENIVSTKKDLLKQWIIYSKSQKLDNVLMSEGLKMLKECGN